MTTRGAETDTDERLLAVAERLFAAAGIDGVSVRSITIEAGANIAAVHYHFGTKVDLVRALVERRVGEVNRDRLTMLRALEAAPVVSTRDVAAAWVLPLARLARDPERRAYLGFIVALQSASPDMRAIASHAFRPHFPRLDAALARALPDADIVDRRFRFGLMVDAAMRALADLDRTRGAWRAQRREVTDDEVVDAIVDAMTGLLKGGRT